MDYTNEYYGGYGFVDLLLSDVEYYWNQEDALDIAEKIVAVYEMYKDFPGHDDCCKGGYSCAKEYIVDYDLEHMEEKQDVAKRG